MFRIGCWPLPDQLSSRRQTPNTKHKTLFDWQINPHPRFLPPRPGNRRARSPLPGRPCSHNREGASAPHNVVLRGANRRHGAANQDHLASIIWRKPPRLIQATERGVRGITPSPKVSDASWNSIPAEGSVSLTAIGLRRRSRRPSPRRAVRSTPGSMEQLSSFALLLQAISRGNAVIENEPHRFPRTDRAARQRIGLPRVESDAIREHRYRQARDERADYTAGRAGSRGCSSGRFRRPWGPG